MATGVKFYDFVEQLALAKHNLNTDTFNAMLTNSAPAQTNTIKTDITEISAGNGYTAGGADTQNTLAESTGTATMTGTMIVWTASGGSIGPFRYVVVYNDTQTSPADPLFYYADYGSSITLAAGETFSVKFNGSSTTGTMATIQ